MRRYLGLAAMGVVMMTGCATTYRAGAPEGSIDVIAHRGASAYAPENTLAAFALAAEQGADWFELDCTLTKDGEVIVIHDPSNFSAHRGDLVESQLPAPIWVAMP